MTNLMNFFNRQHTILEKIIKGGMLIWTLPTSLLQIFCKKDFDFQVNVRNDMDPDDNFSLSSNGLDTPNIIIKNKHFLKSCSTYYQSTCHSENYDNHRCKLQINLLNIHKRVSQATIFFNQVKCLTYGYLLKWAINGTIVTLRTLRFIWSTIIWLP